MKRLSVFLILMLAVAACSPRAKTSQQPEASPTPTTPAASDFSFGFEANTMTIAPQTLGVGAGLLTVNVTMPDGYKFNTLAPLKAMVASSDSTVQVDAGWAAYQAVAPPMPLQIPLTVQAGQATITAHLEIYWCEAVNETLCFVDKHDIQIPLVVSAESDQNQAQAVVALVPPE